MTTVPLKSAPPSQDILPALACGCSGTSRCKEHTRALRIVTHGVCRHPDSVTGEPCNAGNPIHCREMCSRCWSREYRREQRQKRFEETVYGQPDNRDDFVALVYAILDRLKKPGQRESYLRYLASGRETFESRGVHQYLVLLRSTLNHKQYLWFIRELNVGLPGGQRIPDY